MLNVVLFGAPGAGKGTQSLRVSQQYALTHLSTGDILREEVHRGTPTGFSSKHYMEQGELVPDKIIINHLQQNIAQSQEPEGYVFDGFPRTLTQARYLDRYLHRCQNPINMVIHIKVSAQELVKRMLGRAEDSGRMDDREDIIMKRMKVYKKHTLPLIDYYTRQQKLICISGMAPVDKVSGQIVSSINTKISQTTPIWPQTL